MKFKIIMCARAVALVAIVLLSMVIVLTATMRPVYASPKSLYVCSEHHQALFDAYNVNSDGTVAYQARYTLTYATDPAGIAIHEGDNTLFITSEFSYGVELVNATTMTSLGKETTGPKNLAGIDVDDTSDIVYAVERRSNHLYVYDWDSSAKTLTPRAGFNPYDLLGCSGGYGIALDEKNGILWVADTQGNKARAYDVNTWAEDTSKSFTPSHKPVDIDVDKVRGFVYTVSMSYGAGTGAGSNLLSKFDSATSTETTVDMGHQGVGVAVDEVTGLVYVTGADPVDDLSVWNCSTAAFTQLQTTGDIGNPAGLCIPEEIGYNPLGLTKDDGLADDECVYPGDTITYTICFDNLLNDYPVHNVVLVDDLPAETNFVSASDGGTYDSGTHAVTWNIGTLPAWATRDCVTLVVTVKSDAHPETTIVNYATIEFPNPFPPPETIRTTTHKSNDICSAVSPKAAFTFSPPWPQVCETITFDASTSTPDGGTITNYRWNFDDSNITDTLNPIIAHHYATYGTYNVTLTVTDSEGLSDTTWQIVNVRQPPKAAFTFSPPDPATGEIITFDASTSTPDGGTITNYRWNFDDSNITDTLNPITTHHYMIHGVYNVTLIVFDSEDKNDTTWQLVNVTTHDVAVVDVTPESDWLYHGKLCHASINVTVCNEGDVPETFNVTLYYNITAGQIIGVQTVTNLPAGNCTTLTFLWDTTEVAMCHSYNITAYATPVPHEADTTENTMSSPIKVKVRLLGDVNDDGKVDMRDTAMAAYSFGEWPGRPRWLPYGPYADINNDGRCDLRDIAVIARNFGKTCL